MGKVMKAMKAKAATKAKAKAATVKRPAAAKSKSLKDQCEDWKLALTASQGSGDEEMEGTHRDKGKGVKFQKIKSQLPQHIQHMYDVDALQHSSPREFRTMIINKLFKRQGNGTLVLNTKDAVFEESRTVFERKFGKDQSKAMPKSLLVGLYFQGNNETVQAAGEAGDIEEIEDQGKTFYAFKELKSGTERGAVKNQNFNAGGQKLSSNEYYDVVALVDSLGWSFSVAPKDAKQLALGNGGPPEAAQKSFALAKGACEKLDKQAMSLLNKLAPTSSHKVQFVYFFP
jgi:hypothetical protein